MLCILLTCLACTTARFGFARNYRQSSKPSHYMASVVHKVHAKSLSVRQENDKFNTCLANLRTTILDFRGLDSSIILCIRPGILMSVRDFAESFRQAVLASREILSREIGRETFLERVAPRATLGGRRSRAAAEARPPVCA